MIEVDTEQWNDLEFGEAIKEVEETIQQGIQRFPDDTYILGAESDLATLLADGERAEAALRSAFTRNPNNPFIAVRLAKLLIRNDQSEKAIDIYKSSLDSGVSDKQVEKYMKHALVHIRYAVLQVKEANRE